MGANSSGATQLLKKSVTRDPKTLRSLQYFDSVARHCSVSAAAREMGVTPSAISHQIRGLTSTLGEALIAKNGRGIALTDAGQLLHDKLTVSLASIEALVEEVIGNEKKFVRLAVCSSFGPGWLIPRLPNFRKTNPDIDLELRLYTHDPEQTNTIADAFVTAQPLASGFDSISLFREMLVAVESPDTLRSTSNRPRNLITTDLETGELGDDWEEYAMLRGLDLTEIKTGNWVRCSHYLLAMEFAKSGMGVAQVPEFLARCALTDGTLTYFDKQSFFQDVPTNSVSSPPVLRIRQSAPLRDGWHRKRDHLLKRPKLEIYSTGCTPRI